jgi:hypothetical protein
MQQPLYLLRYTPPSPTFIETPISFDLSLLQVFRCLLGPRTFDSLERPLACKQASLPIILGGISFIPIATIALITYLGSWAFIAPIITARFMVNQQPFLLEALV